MSDRDGEHGGGSRPAVDGGCGCGCAGDSDCCQGVTVTTPVAVHNPPSRSAIAYRSGTYGSFFSSMRARLSSPGYPALAPLTVRSTDDPAIALLDGWAVIGDVLTFYTERIANEGYLRTATEDTSLRLLGRLVGYAPRPGVAASTYLAYTLDRDPNGRDTTVTIPAGSRAQSVPAPGQESQAYEISEDLPARWSCNDLRVLRRRPIQLTQDDLATRSELQLAGTATNLKPGDRLLFVFGAESGRQVLTVVPAVSIDPVAGVTVVGLGAPPAPTLATVKQGHAILASAALADEMYTRSRIVRRFVDGPVVALDRDLPQITDDAVLAARLAELLSQLNEAAVPGQPYDNVRAWFASRRAEVAALLDQATAQQATPARPLFAELALDRLSTAEGRATSGPVDPALRALAAALGALRRPASRPPVSSSALRRDPAVLFGPGSDLRAQLLGALDPRLRDIIYDAWPHQDVTVPLALTGLQALRVVATPFGATAPLQPVFDNGVLTGQREWPLLGSQQLSISVTYVDRRPSRGNFVYTEQNVSQVSFPTPLSGTNTFPLGPWTVTVERVDPPEPGPDVTEPAAATATGVSVTLERGQDRAEFFLSDLNSDDNLQLTGAQPDPLTLGPDGVASGTLVDWQLRAQRTDPGGRVDIGLSRSVAPLSNTVLNLDAVYEGIAPGSYLVVDRPRKGVPPDQGGIPGSSALARVVTRVVDVRTVALAAFGISGKVTQLNLADAWLDQDDTLLSHIRDATVYARGEPLALTTEPDTTDVAGDVLELAELYQGARSGQWVVISGERTDVPGIPAGSGIPAAEVSMVAGVRQFVDTGRPGDTVHTVLTLAVPLAYSYRRDSVHVFANVAPATQGASRSEPIGSGDANRAGQTFTLFQAPLTWLAADNPLGARNTLEIRVDGVAWHEVDSFVGQRATDRVYVTSTGDDGRTRVTFGDGEHGARLPTGVENVRASYRVGVGAAANVPRDMITQLAARPLGVSAVHNPVPATGGADGDDASQVRRGIPLAVSALDRLVGVPDYADFSRARAGIGRAAARRLFDGVREIVHVTIAGTDDVPLADDSGIVTSLRSSLATFGDPGLPVRVAIREPVLLLVAASIAVSPDYSFTLVEPQVRAALLDRLGFAARELGQPAYLSEVVATAQRVPGVDHLHVEIFEGVPGGLTPQGLEQLLDTLGTPKPVVPARLAGFEVRRYVTAQPAETLTAIAGNNGVTVAELIALNPGLTESAPVPGGTSLVVFRGVRPAQLVTLAAAVPDTLILKEAA